MKCIEKCNLYSLGHIYNYSFQRCVLSDKMITAVPSTINNEPCFIMTTPAVTLVQRIKSNLLSWIC